MVFQQNLLEKSFSVIDILSDATKACYSQSVSSNKVDYPSITIVNGTSMFIQ